MMDTDLPPGASNSTGHLSTIGYGTAPGRMHHSQSTPAGVDGAGGASRTPPATPKKGGKMLAVRVQMLDDTISMFQVQSKALGRVLFEQVCRQLHLLEADYFGLEYQEVNGTKFWLDLEKGMCRQVGLSLVDPLLRFCVKFYTPDPARLEEEFTRYLFCLQIKRDLAHGCIQCNENTAALMASYIVQAECGDFVPEDYPDHTYLSGYKFFPQQDADLEQRIMENHKKHAGQSPAEADMNLLETARRCELYGMQMHPAKDHENVPLNLAVAHLGIVVFQNFTKINTFSWAKIRKISFKRKRFLVKLHPEGYGYYKDVVEFFFEGRNECKNFWKKCVENHGFFRCSSVKRVPRQRTRVLSRGSSFRYSGKTQKQIVEFVRDNYVKRQTFQRSQSFRASHSLRSSRANVSTPSAPINASLSAHPLLPLPPGSDAISVEWDKQPHYLEASLMMRGYTETEARAALGAERRRSEGAQLARPPSTPTTFTAMRDRERGIVTRAEVNHHHMAESPPPLPMTTPLDSPGSTWSQLTYQHNTATNTAGDPIRAPPVPVATTQDQDVSSPGEGDTTSTGSFYLFPMSPMPTNHMGYGRTAPSGGVSVDNIASQDKKQKISSDVNENVEVTDGVQTKGNVVIGRGGLESQSIHSMDVLSGGESDAADTLSRPQKLFDSGTMCKSTMGGVERRKKWMGNPDFFATKELLMTERAYKKDLEVITMWWSQLVSEGVSLGWLSSGHAEALGRPCLAVESVALAAASLLPQVDACFTAMDTTIDSQNIEDTTSISQILRDHLRENLSIYEEYILRGGYLVGRVETARRGDGGAERVCCSLEASRAPLPLATHLLRPLHRILYYGETLQRLAANEEDVWKEEDKTVLSHLVELGKTQLLHAENHAHLCQLQRDITGYDNLLVAGREFIRMGCLFKNSNKGLLQRMFFLFSDTLLYASKTSGTSEQLFRVHSAIPLHSVQLQPADYANAFILHYEGSVLTLSANSVEERGGWWRDLTEGAAAACDTSEDTQPQNISKQNAVHTSIDDLTHSGSQGTGVGVSLAHVCWHRCTSLTRAQLHLASRTQLSGYLLRKFKNSHGWQKLWVVYAMFALYFYKGWQDNLPLASLPLLGYNVTTPNERDGINKDFVFKLVFKNHVYFFRAESEHTYNRWMEVIRTAMTTQ